jgi:hypothetical protein
MGLQREVPGVGQMDFGIRDIVFERFGADGDEDHVVLAPDREQRRLVCAQIPVILRIPRNIAAIVDKQVELDLGVAGPRGQCVVEGEAFGCDQRSVGLG